MRFIDSWRMGQRKFTKVLSFGEVLKKFRSEAGLSQVTLAKRADVSPSLIAHLELNRRTPRRDKVSALADALALSEKERERLLNAAGFSPDGKQRGASFLDRSPLTNALEDLMNDPRLTPKQKLRAEQVLEAFVKWLQDQFVEGKIKV